MKSALRRSILPLLCVSFAAHAAAQDAARAPGTLLLRVVDSATRRPLPNAEVSAEGRRGLTDAQGEVRVLWPASGALHVRVRQLGFGYAERDLRRPMTQTEEDTTVVALARLRWALPQMIVRGERKCRESDARNVDVALSQASMELLRFGAEQFENFRRAYPFDLTAERRTAIATPSGPAASRGLGDALEMDQTTSAEWGDRYVPDGVVQRYGVNQYFVPLLFVSALADSAFWDRHCFVARGVQTLEGRRLIRLDFFPAVGVREPEWAGSAWLDSARNVLARVDFRLTNLRQEPGPQRFEGYTVFSTPSPFIAIPDSTVAWWTAGVPGGSFGGLRLSDGRQSYVIRELRYVGKEPPRER